MLLSKVAFFSLCFHLHPSKGIEKEKEKKQRRNKSITVNDPNNCCATLQQILKIGFLAQEQLK